MCVSHEALQRSGLVLRESWYLDSPPNPLPTDKTRVEGVIPEGWIRIDLPRRGRKACLSQESLFWTLVNEGAWCTAVSKTTRARETWSDCVSGGYEPSYRHWLFQKRHCQKVRGPGPGRGGRFHRSRFIGPPLNSFVHVARSFRADHGKIRSFSLPERNQRVWVPSGFTIQRDRVQFVRAREDVR
jgi:hypothetical protein